MSSENVFTRLQLLGIFCVFSIAFAMRAVSLCGSIDHCNFTLNAELTKKALEKVGNPNILINLVSRRVRQLNSGAGALSHPLVAPANGLGAADVALLEIIEEKIGWEMPEPLELVQTTRSKKRKRR